MIRFGFLTRGSIGPVQAEAVGRRALTLHADLYVSEHIYRSQHYGYMAQATVKGKRFESVVRPRVEDALNAALDVVQASLDLIPAWTDADVERLKERIRA